MLKAITEKGEMKNVKVSENGELLVKNVEGQNEEILGNVETTLNSSIQTIGTEATTITVNKKVTSIAVANYSETADITMTIGDSTYETGSNLAIDFPINKTIASISLTSTEANTKVQLVIKGVE